MAIVIEAVARSALKLIRKALMQGLGAGSGCSENTNNLIFSGLLMGLETRGRTSSHLE